MLSYAKSATARHRLNGFKHGKTHLFNSWGDIKWAYFQKKVECSFNSGVIAVNFMKWSAALTLSRCGKTPPLFRTTPLAPVGPLWPKVFVGPKNPDRCARGSTDEARSSPGSDGGNTTDQGCVSQKHRKPKLIVAPLVLRCTQAYDAFGRRSPEQWLCCLLYIWIWTRLISDEVLLFSCLLLWNCSEMICTGWSAIEISATGI